MAYEEMKKFRGTSQTLSDLDYLVMAAVSKTFALTITYPYQVVRSRLQVGWI